MCIGTIGIQSAYVRNVAIEPSGVNASFGQRNRSELIRGTPSPLWIPAFAGMTVTMYFERSHEVLAVTRPTRTVDSDRHSTRRSFQSLMSVVTDATNPENGGVGDWTG